LTRKKQLYLRNAIYARTVEYLLAAPIGASN
jgi:hypothetical protein